MDVTLKIDRELVIRLSNGCTVHRSKAALRYAIWAPGAQLLAEYDNLEGALKHAMHYIKPDWAGERARVDEGDRNFQQWLNS